MNILRNQKMLSFKREKLRLTKTSLLDDSTNEAITYEDTSVEDYENTLDETPTERRRSYLFRNHIGERGKLEIRLAQAQPHRTR